MERTPNPPTQLHLDARWRSARHRRHPSGSESLDTADREEARKRLVFLKARVLEEQPVKDLRTKTWHDACIEWLKFELRSESDRYSLKNLDYPDIPLIQCTGESLRHAIEGKTSTAGTYNRYRAIVVAALNMA